MSLYQYILTELTLMNWQDYAELMCIAVSIFYILRLLHKDEYKNLTQYIYAFFALLFFSYSYDLHAVTTILTLTSPIIGILLTIVHQEQLQKNFISHRYIIPSQKSSCIWINELIKNMLHHLNNGNSCMLIIEKHEAVDTFFETFHRIHADITHDLLHLLLTRSEENAILVLTTSGKLTSFNPTFLDINNKTIESDKINAQYWEKRAQLIASKTKALCCIADAKTHTFKAITQKHIIAPLSAKQLQTMIQKHCLLIKQSKQKANISKKTGGEHAPLTDYENRH